MKKKNGCEAEKKNGQKLYKKRIKKKKKGQKFCKKRIPAFHIAHFLKKKKKGIALSFVGKSS